MKTKQKFFRKIGDPKIIEIEYYKSQLAFNIGEDTGLFYVPKITNYQQNKGLLEFEYLYELETIENLIKSKDRRLFGVLRKLGDALIVIHNNLSLPDKFMNDLPIVWMDSNENNVFIHGDLTIQNVCFHSPSEKLVILDWSTSPLLNPKLTFGTRYFDILWFLRSLFTTGPNIIPSPQFTNELANIFIQTYVEFSPGDFDINLFFNLRKFLLKQSHSIMREQLIKSNIQKKLRILKYFMISSLIWRLYEPSFSKQ